MNKFLPYINLMRLNRPTGIWLLFLPCLAGILLAAKFTIIHNLFPIIILFLAGSVVMRSAGCVINDIFDRNFDKNIARTINRPIASGHITVKKAMLLLLILLIIGLIILCQFNKQVIFQGFGILFLVILYPLAKRITYYPQIFLGITFNFGVIMSSAAILEIVTLPSIILYLSFIIWTVTYDTIYAYQDIEDDLKMGVKSTAIIFKKNPYRILNILTISQFSLLFYVGFLANLGWLYYLLIAIAVIYLFWTINKCNFKKPQECLHGFKSNVLVGLIIALAILIG